MPRLRRKRKSRTTAPAAVYFSAAKNAKGQRQICVYAECRYAGTIAGPIWSHEDAAVRRALATLTSKCGCGRSFHKARGYEGHRVKTKRKKP
jgi:hypothetical protein